MTPAAFLKNANVPELPSDVEYGDVVWANAERWFLSPRKVAITIQDYRRAKLADKIIMAQSVGLIEDRADLDNLIDIQTANGNWNFDPYMHGLANGMLLRRHTAFDVEGEVPFLDAPDEWLADRPFEAQIEAICERLNLSWALKGKVPAAPGTSRIPANHVRLYHYTRVEQAGDLAKHKAAESLRKQGIKLGNARGQSFGEPNQIWSSTRQPENYKTYVEFSVAKDDPRIGGTIRMVRPGGDLTFTADIKPKDIIAVHEHWHFRYRHLRDDSGMMEKVAAGEFDRLIDKPEYGPAVFRAKNDLGESSFERQIATVLEYASSVTQARTAKRRADPAKQQQGRLAARDHKKISGQRRGQRQASGRHSRVVESVESNDYRGNHTAPGKQSGSPLHDLTDTYPDDIYSKEGPRYYGDGAGDRRDRKTVMIMRVRRGKPNAPVTVYRAVPPDAGDKINVGDWVTINADYATAHGESALRGEYKIISKKVRAKELFTDGNSVHEWGYSP